MRQLRANASLSSWSGATLAPVGAVLVFFCPVLPPAELAAATLPAGHTDQSLSAALVGTWEFDPAAEAFPFDKIFASYKPDGTVRVVAIGKLFGSAVRADAEGSWRIERGKLIERPLTATVPIRAGQQTSRIVSISPSAITVEHNREVERLHRSQWPAQLPQPISRVVTLLSEAERERLVAANPKLEYPILARKRWNEGTGFFVVTSDATGRVTSVTLARSSGHRLLDHAALTGLRNWQLRPGAPQKILLPVRFVMRRR